MAFNGSLLRLKIKVAGSFLLVAEETKTDFSLTKDTFETSNKDSGPFRNRISSYKSGEIQCEAFVNYVAAAGHISYAQLFSIYNGTLSNDCQFTTGITGDFGLDGNFHITKLDTAGPTEQGATVSFTLTSDGAITGTVNA